MNMRWSSKTAARFEDIMYLECFFLEQNHKAHYAVKVLPAKRQALKQAMAKGQVIELTEYGDVLHSAWGPLPLRVEDMPLNRVTSQ